MFIDFTLTASISKENYDTMQAMYKNASTYNPHTFDNVSVFARKLCRSVIYSRDLTDFHIEKAAVAKEFTKHEASYIVIISGKYDNYQSTFRPQE